MVKDTDIVPGLDILCVPFDPVVTVLLECLDPMNLYLFDFCFLTL